jgi:transcriptional regulator with XRE-family HTH domain
MNKEMRKQRKAAGLTLLQLAQKSGLNYSTVQSLEAGRGQGFNVEFKKAVTVVLDKALGKATTSFFTLWPEELKRIQHIQEFIK